MAAQFGFTPVAPSQVPAAPAQGGFSPMPTAPAAQGQAPNPAINAIAGQLTQGQPGQMQPHQPQAVPGDAFDWNAFLAPEQPAAPAPTQAPGQGQEVQALQGQIAQMQQQMAQMAQMMQPAQAQQPAQQPLPTDPYQFASQVQQQATQQAVQQAIEAANRANESHQVLSEYRAQYPHLTAYEPEIGVHYEAVMADAQARGLQPTMRQGLQAAVASFTGKFPQLANGYPMTTSLDARAYPQSGAQAGDAQSAQQIMRMSPQEFDALDRQMAQASRQQYYGG